MSSSNFKRTITKLGIAVLAINGLIGAGIFALPAGAAELSGNLSPWMFIVCALLMSLVILSFAQLSAGFDKTGGPVLYTQKAFGSHVSFQTTWLLYIGRLTALAANSNALVLYLGFIYPPFNEGFLKIISLVCVLSMLTAINLLGVRKTMLVLKSITMLKILPLILFIAVGFFHLEPEKLILFEPMPFSQMEATLLLLVYAFIGFEGALVPAGESENPTKNIAKALVLTLITTAVLYFCIQAIAVSVLPNLASTEAPIAAAASTMTGDIGAVIITVAAIISIAGNLSTVIFTAPRMTYALAEQGNFPSWFAKVTSEEKIPRNAILFLVIVAGFLAITGSFIWLAIVSSLARLIGYFIAIAALVKLQPELRSKGQWRLPLGLVIPLSALCVCLWLSIQASVNSWLMTALFMIAGSGLYFLGRHKKTETSH
ncbi:APC family permease [Thalassotalea atypica]|uniref:APC family permease n=1 Tax=Thalassotalea atypica TaxID=2054316 RepID=UPI00257301FF|nr:amino acid permease [Thalassotalea atypica]